MLKTIKVPASAAPHWSDFCGMMAELSAPTTAWSGQIGLLQNWYRPHLESLYDHVPARSGDLEKLEQIAAAYPTRGRFLTELTLDPPDASGAHAGIPQLDEGYLRPLHHSFRKGQEWDTVFVLNEADGCIPSDLAVGSPDQIEEERGLLYVAMTRAKQHLHLLQPQRRFRTQQHRNGDGHVYVPRSRFIPDGILGLFEQRP
jgi:DNA helicase-2/ATP-dependent DNA helicase PcrA